MILGYSIDGKVQINISDFIKIIPELLPPSMNGKSATPVVNQLFKINKDAEFLDPSES